MKNKNLFLIIRLIFILFFLLIPLNVVSAQEELIIVAPSEVYEQSSFNISMISNGTILEDITVEIDFFGEIEQMGSYYDFSIKSVSYTGLEELFAPEVNNTQDLFINASAEGYKNNTTKIKVVNKPQIYINGSEAKNGLVLNAFAEDGIKENITIIVKFKEYSFTAKTDSDGDVFVPLSEFLSESPRSFIDVVATATKLGYKPTYYSTIFLHYDHFWEDNILNFILLFIVILIVISLIILLIEKVKKKKFFIVRKADMFIFFSVVLILISGVISFIGLLVLPDYPCCTGRNVPLDLTIFLCLLILGVYLLILALYFKKRDKKEN